MNNDKDYCFSLEKEEINKGTPVFLKIYHVTSANSIFKFLGIGIYHSSVLLSGIEFSFGFSAEGSCGIIEMNDGNLSLKLKEKLYLGSTIYKISDINRLIINISKFWQGSSYDPYFKNCNHFTNVFSKYILQESIDFPCYVNRFVNMNLIFGCFSKSCKQLVP